MISFKSEPTRLFLHVARESLAAGINIAAACEYLSRTSDDQSIGNWGSPKCFERAARCFHPRVARPALEVLAHSLGLAQRLVANEYHWLLIHDSIDAWIHSAASVDSDLHLLTSEADAAWATWDGERLQPRLHDIVTLFFESRGFLMTPSEFANGRPSSTPGLFGVVHGLVPHPDELVLHEFGTRIE